MSVQDLSKAHRLSATAVIDPAVNQADAFFGRAVIFHNMAFDEFGYGNDQIA